MTVAEWIGENWDREPEDRTTGINDYGWGVAGLQAYLKGDFSPFARQGIREGLEYGVGKSGWDWLVGPKGGFTPLGSGLTSGGTTLLSGLLTGETEGLAGKTAASGGGAAAGQYIGSQAMKSGASGAAANAAGAGVGGIASGLYEAATKGKISKSTEWSTIGAMVGSIFPGPGTLLGGLIGGLAGGFMSNKKPSIAELSRTESGNAIVWDGKQFVPQQPLDAKVTVAGEEYNLNPKQKAGLARKIWLASVKKANELNERFAGKDYAKMSKEDAYEFDKMRELYSAVSVPADEQGWRQKYDEWTKKTGRDDLPYDLWRKEAEENIGWTNSPLNTGNILTGYEPQRKKELLAPYGGGLWQPADSEGRESYETKKRKELFREKYANGSENPEIQGLLDQMTAEDADKEYKSKSARQRAEEEGQGGDTFRRVPQVAPAQMNLTPEQVEAVHGPVAPSNNKQSGMNLTPEQIEAVHAPILPYSNIEDILRTMK